MYGGAPHARPGARGFGGINSVPYSGPSTINSTILNPGQHPHVGLHPSSQLSSQQQSPYSGVPGAQSGLYSHVHGGSHSHLGGAPAATPDSYRRPHGYAIPSVADMAGANLKTALKSGGGLGGGGLLHNKVACNILARGGKEGAVEAEECCPEHYQAQQQQRHHQLRVSKEQEQEEEEEQEQEEQ